MKRRSKQSRRISMTLLQKLNTINFPQVISLRDGNAQTAEEFWDSFIVHNLPAKEVVLKWHEVLMEYVKRPNAMFAIRCYNTAAKDSYDSLRRGFLTRTNAGFSFFYTDNLDSFIGNFRFVRMQFQVFSNLSPVYRFVNIH